MKQTNKQNVENVREQEKPTEKVHSFLFRHLYLKQNKTKIKINIFFYHTVATFPLRKKNKSCNIYFVYKVTKCIRFKANAI